MSGAKLEAARLRLLDRHIASHVIQGTLLALVVLLSLFAFVAFVDDLGDLGKGNYTLPRALLYMLLTLPRRAFEVLPLAAVVGSLMGLGALSANAELVVMRASGVSAARIIVAVLKGALVLMAGAVLLGEVLMPPSERYARNMRSLAITDQITLRTRYGFWWRDKDGLQYFNIRKILPEGTIADVYIYELDPENRLRSATFAKQGIFVGDHWQLQDIRQSELSPAGVPGSVRGSNKKRMDWHSAIKPELIGFTAVRPESSSFLQIYGYLARLRNHGLQTAQWELALWSRLVYPLNTAVMVFLSVPLVLGGLRNAAIGQRIIAGVLVGTAFHVISETAGHAGIVYGFDPLASVLAPPLLFAGASVWLLRRTGSLP